MIYGDIIHPALNHFADRVNRIGYTKIGRKEVSHLNDFVSYLYFAIPHGNFAFYPLFSESNVGSGQTGVGIGGLAEHTNIIFNGGASWSTSGAHFSTLAQSASINFSGDGRDDFRFRYHDCTIFYVFRHERADNEETLFRAGVRCPYFWVDDSVDNFGVLAPEFSNDNRRSRGTTYIYDEIYGPDKKGMAVDWSAPSANHSGIPVQFKSLGNDKNCLALYCNYSGYELSDKNTSTILTGHFIDSYFAPEAPYDFLPRRLTIGGGCSNIATSSDVGGVPHLCSCVLVISGNYSHASNAPLHTAIRDKLMALS